MYKIFSKTLILFFIFFSAYFIFAPKAQAITWANLNFSGASIPLAEELKNSKEINAARNFVLDITNVAVILFLLIIAILNILRVNIEAFNIKRMLPAMILGIILANFSYVIVVALVDFAQVLSDFFTTGFPNAGEMAKAVTGLLYGSFLGGAWEAISGNLWQTILALIALGIPIACTVDIFLILLVIFPAILVICMALILYLRKYIIWFLFIVSPLVMVMGFFPPAKKYFSSWWLALLQWALTGPIILFFLRLAWIFGGANSNFTGPNVPIWGNIYGPTTFVSAGASSAEFNLGGFPLFMMIFFLMALACYIPFVLGSGINKVWSKLFGPAAGFMGGALMAPYRTTRSLATAGAKKWWNEGGGKKGIQAFAYSNIPLLGKMVVKGEEAQLRGDETIKNVLKEERGRRIGVGVMAALQRVTPENRLKRTEEGGYTPEEKAFLARADIPNEAAKYMSDVEENIRETNARSGVFDENGVEMNNLEAAMRGRLVKDGKPDFLTTQRVLARGEALRRQTESQNPEMRRRATEGFNNHNATAQRLNPNAGTLRSADFSSATVYNSPAGGQPRGPQGRPFGRRRQAPGGGPGQAPPPPMPGAGPAGGPGGTPPAPTPGPGGPAGGQPGGGFGGGTPTPGPGGTPPGGAGTPPTPIPGQTVVPPQPNPTQTTTRRGQTAPAGPNQIYASLRRNAQAQQFLRSHVTARATANNFAFNDDAHRDQVIDQINHRIARSRNARLHMRDIGQQQSNDALNAMIDSIFTQPPNPPAGTP